MKTQLVNYRKIALTLLITYLSGYALANNDSHKLDHWYVHQTMQLGPVIVINNTDQTRVYQIIKVNLQSATTYFPLGDQYSFKLNNGTLCALDTAIYDPQNKSTIFAAMKNKSFPFGFVLEDITDGKIGLYNGAYITGNNNLNTCANEGNDKCAGNKWGSWHLGIMPKDDISNGNYSYTGGRVQYARSEWGKGSDTLLYYTNNWQYQQIALIMTQVSIDGSGRALDQIYQPTAAQVHDAPLCSKSLWIK